MIVVEPTGAETELLLEVGGEQLIVVLHGRTEAQPDETVYLRSRAAAPTLFSGPDGSRLN